MGEQAIKSMVSLDDLTVVVLGQDDPSYAARAAHYYRTQFRKVLQVAAPAADTVGAWQAQLLASLEQVRTPFSVLTLDCDFLLPQATAAAVQALQADSSYLMAQGYALGYQPGNGEVSYYKLGAAAPGEVDSHSARARIKAHSQQGLPAWRAVVRSEALKAAVGSLPGDLGFDGWCVALAYALLSQGPSTLLAHTSVLAHYRPSAASAVTREEQLSQAVRRVHQWDAAHGAQCADGEGFEVLNGFVRNTHAGGEAPLIFTSTWSQPKGEPACRFEPQQFVEMPYYNAPLFAELQALEFLVHAWPAGQAQTRALEGNWVRQQAMLTVHANDTAESLRARYRQAFELGLFNPQVAQRLLDAQAGHAAADETAELRAWVERLAALPEVNVPGLLAATPSGKVLAAVDAATPVAAERERVLAHLGKVGTPQIAFIVLDLEDSDEALQDTFDSLLASGARNFKIVVLKAGKLPAITTAKDTLHFIKVTADNVITHLNQVVRQLPSDWLMLLDAGDLLTTGGLLRLQVELPGAEACQAICANEVQRDSAGRLLSVVRPGCNLDLLRSRPELMARHWLVRRESVVALGGYSPTCAGALELDLLLRLVEQNGIAGLAHLDEYLVIAQHREAAMGADALATLKRHLNVLGYRGQVNESANGSLQVDFRHPSTPQVSILLSADSEPDMLRACLASIVQRTRYARYEVIVACEAAHAESIATSLSSVPGLGNRVRLFAGDAGSTRADLINQAASQALGEYLVLLSSRTQLISPAWIDALLNEALRPEVGVVGAQLIGQQGLISHAGFSLLGNGEVNATWLGATPGQAASALGLAAVRSCAAVSGDLLMVRKALFEQLEGLAPVEGADIDLCLKAAAAGMLVVWAPQALAFNAGIAPLSVTGRQALQANWPGAFSARVVVDVEHGVDISRQAQAGQPVALEWLAALQ